MVNKHEKTLYVTNHQGNANETTMRDHLIPVRIGRIKKKQVLVKMWKKRNPRTLLVGMQTGAAIMENSMEVPHIYICVYVYMYIIYT